MYHTGKKHAQLLDFPVAKKYRAVQFQFNKKQALQRRKKAHQLDFWHAKFLSKPFGCKLKQPWLTQQKL
jgi:hypothetical protein